MTYQAKLFINGRSQAVRLPAALRFDTTDVFIQQDSETGNVILSRKPTTWDGLLQAFNAAGTIPPDFLSLAARKDIVPHQNPFAGWTE